MVRAARPAHLQSQRIRNADARTVSKAIKLVRDGLEELNLLVMALIEAMDKVGRDGRARRDVATDVGDAGLAKVGGRRRVGRLGDGARGHGRPVRSDMLRGLPPNQLRLEF